MEKWYSLYPFIIYQTMFNFMLTSVLLPPQVVKHILPSSNIISAIRNIKQQETKKIVAPRTFIRKTFDTKPGSSG